MSSDSSSSSDESSDDESPQTGANVWRAGTYGTVVARLDDGKVKVQWEGGDTSTLDADVYAAALRSYAKSPRARGENDATSSSSDDDDDDDADVDRQLLVGDELLSPCGLRGTVEEISKEGVVIVQWGKLPKPASREPVRSLRRAAQKPVDYATAYSTNVDEPKPLSMDDALAFRKLWLEKQEGGVVHASQEDEEDDWDSSQGTSREASSQEASSQEEPSQDSIDELPPAKTSRVTKSGPYTQQSDASDGRPARLPAAARPSAPPRPQPRPRASPTKPLRPTEPPVSPLASQDDEVPYIGPPGPHQRLAASQEASQPCSQISLQGSAANPATLAAVEALDALKRRMAAATVIERRGSSCTRVPEKMLRVLSPTDKGFWDIAKDARWPWKNLYETLKKLGGGGDLSEEVLASLNCPHVDLQAMGDSLLVVVKKDEAMDFQDKFNETSRSMEDLVALCKFDVCSQSRLFVFEADNAPLSVGELVSVSPSEAIDSSSDSDDSSSSDDDSDDDPATPAAWVDALVVKVHDDGSCGVWCLDGRKLRVPATHWRRPPEIFAQVAINTPRTRAAWPEAGCRYATDLVKKMIEYMNPVDRGDRIISGKMRTFGFRLIRWANSITEDKKRKYGGGKLGPYDFRQSKVDKANADEDFCDDMYYVLTAAFAQEGGYAPFQKAARYAVAKALNAPPLCKGLRLEDVPALMLAASENFACHLHKDKSGHANNETILFPPKRGTPSDVGFPIPAAGTVVPLSGHGGVFITLPGGDIVHGTTPSKYAHELNGFALVTNDDLLEEWVQSALAPGCRKSRRME